MKWIVLLCVVLFGYFIFKNLFPYVSNMDRLEEFLYEKNLKEKCNIDELLSKFDIAGMKTFIKVIIFIIILITIVVICAALRGAFTY